ncbi:MAG: glutaminyl-peptide cyclotransferase [Dehalococcoidia bacterium]
MPERSCPHSYPHPPPQSPKLHTYRVANTFPHDSNAYTQGLVFEDGFLYEGTGRYGQSSLRKVDLETGEVLKMHDLPEQFFGEGITIFEDRIIQLTLQSGTGFVYEKERFELLGEFGYRGEGWGLTHDGEQLIMSDGTSTLRFLNPETFEKTGEIDVHYKGEPVTKLNELEHISGEVFANVFLTDRIARINPRTGEVVGWIELKGLLNEENLSKPVDVLNGIAYNAQQEQLLVTGKLWPEVFEIELITVE